MTILNLPPKKTSSPQVLNERHGERLFWATFFGVAFLLGCLADVNVVRARFLGFEAPPCIVETLFGSHNLCPGFGLTRSTSLAIQGQWSLAWGLNPGGILIAFVLMGGFFLYFMALVRGGFTQKMLFVKRVGRNLFLGAVLAPWCCRVFIQ